MSRRPDSLTVFRWAVVAALGLLTVGLAALAVYTVRNILVLAFVALFVAVSLYRAYRAKRALGALEREDA